VSTTRTRTRTPSSTTTTTTAAAAVTTSSSAAATTTPQQSPQRGRKPRPKATQQQQKPAPNNNDDDDDDDDDGDDDDDDNDDDNDGENSDVPDEVNGGAQQTTTAQTSPAAAVGQQKRKTKPTGQKTTGKFKNTTVSVLPVHVSFFNTSTDRISFRKYFPTFFPGPPLTFDGPCVVSFDGAQRGVSAGVASCSAFCFVPAGQHVCTMELLEDERVTNIVAELSGAILAVAMCLRLHTLYPSIQNFQIRGDCSFIIAKMNNGHLNLVSSDNSNMTNHKQWHELKSLISSAPPTITISWEWIPRALNKAADHLCNLVLDHKQSLVEKSEIVLVVNPELMTTTTSEKKTLDSDVLSDYVTKHSHPSKRTLPHRYHILWANLVNTLLQNALKEQTEFSWFCFICAPSLFLFPQSNVSLTVNFAEWQNMEKALKHAEKIFLAPIEKNDKQPITEPERRAELLCREGRYGTALGIVEDNKAEIVNVTKEQEKQFWPDGQSAFIHRFQEYPALTQFPFDFVQLCVRKLKRRKSPDLLGWTRELLQICTENREESDGMNWENFLLNLQNGLLPKLAMEHLLLDKGFILKTGAKSRPLVSPLVFGKILWCRAFLKQTNFTDSSDSAVSARLLQAYLNEGYSAWHLDAKNAFNSVSRKAIRDGIENGGYGELKQLFNLFYAKKNTLLVLNKDFSFSNVTVTCGTKQGCLSSAKLFQIALSTIKPHILSIAPFVSHVDDFYIFEKNFNMALHAQLAPIFSSIGLFMYGPKTTLISRTTPNYPAFAQQHHHVSTSSSSSSSSSSSAFLPAPATLLLSSYAVVQGAFKTLGTVCSVNTAMPRAEVDNAKMSSFLALVQKLKNIKLPLQCKYHLFSTLLLRLRYYFLSSPVCDVPSLHHVDNVIFESFRDVLQPGNPLSFSSLLQLPIEEGGLGLGLEIIAAKYKNNILEKVNAALPLHPLLPQKINLETTKIPHTLLEKQWRMKMLEDKLSTNEKLMHAAHKDVRHAILLRQIPAPPYIIKDDIFDLMLAVRTGFLPPRFVSSCDKVSSHPSPLLHAMNCIHCAHFTARHNTVLYALAAAIRTAGVVVIVNPTHLPLPETASGALSHKHINGPDLVVHTETLHCLDVTIINSKHEHAEGRIKCPLTHAIMRKNNTYKKWEETYKMKCHAIPLTPFGAVASHAFDLFSTYSTKSHRSYAQHVCLQLQKALFVGLNNAFTHMRHFSLSSHMLTRQRPDRRRQQPTATSSSAAPASSSSNDTTTQLTPPLAVAVTNPTAQNESV